MRELPADLRKKRFARRLQVRFWSQGEAHPKAAYTTNISATGMFVSTATPLPSGSRIRIEVINENKSFMVEGVVVHAARVSPVLRQLKESGMGIRFLSVIDLMAELIPEFAQAELSEEEVVGSSPAGAAPAVSPPPANERSAPIQDERPAPRVGLASQAPPRRVIEDEKPVPRSGSGGARRPFLADEPAAPRVAPKESRSGKGLGSDYEFHCKIEFQTLEELQASFDRDLSNGGAFVSTDKPAKLHERVTVDLQLPGPEARTLSFAARVVHVLAPPPGSQTQAGMGLEFIDPDRVVRELSALLKAE